MQHVHAARGGKKKKFKKHRLKWQKMTFWRLLQCTWSGEEKLTIQVDISWKWRQQQSLKKMRKKRIKNYTTDRQTESGWGKLYTLVYTLYRMQPRSVFLWTWDGRTRWTSVLLPSTVWNSRCTVSISTLRSSYRTVQVPPLDQSEEWQKNKLSNQRLVKDWGSKPERDPSVLGSAGRDETRWEEKRAVW